MWVVLNRRSCKSLGFPEVWFAGHKGLPLPYSTITRRRAGAGRGLARARLGERRGGGRGRLRPVLGRAARRGHQPRRARRRGALPGARPYPGLTSTLFLARGSTLPCSWRAAPGLARRRLLRRALAAGLRCSLAACGARAARARHSAPRRRRAPQARDRPQALTCQVQHRAQVRQLAPMLGRHAPRSPLLAQLADAAGVTVASVSRLGARAPSSTSQQLALSLSYRGRAHVMRAAGVAAAGASRPGARRPGACPAPGSSHRALWPCSESSHTFQCLGVRMAHFCRAPHGRFRAGACPAVSATLCALVWLRRAGLRRDSGRA